MKIVYLDQNKWIDLARAVKTPACYPKQRAALEVLVGEANAGRVVVPLTASNIYETHKIANQERRDHLAWVQATLSQGLVFRGRHKRLEVEITDLLRAAYGLERLNRDPKWFLSDVHFECILEIYDPRGPRIPAKMVEWIRCNPSRSLFLYLTETPEAVRAKAVRKFTEGSDNLRKRLEELRTHNLKETPSMRRRIHGARLIASELDLILSIARKADLPEKDETALLQRHAKRIVEQCPTYFIEREMVLRLETHARSIEENDFRDMQTFCAVVNYADFVVAENLFSNVAIQAGLHKKYNTSIITKLPDLPGFLSVDGG